MKTLGPLLNCPLQFHNYDCPMCKRTFSFLGGSRCECEKAHVKDGKQIKAHKLKAKRIVVNNIKFPSFSEGLRYSKLAYLEFKKVISDLKLQTKYPMPREGKPFCNYIDDFNFLYQNKRIVEDVKGKETPVFRLKAKMFKFYYPELELELTAKPKKSKKNWKFNINKKRS